MSSSKQNCIYLQYVLTVPIPKSLQILQLWYLQSYSKSIQLFSKRHIAKLQTLWNQLSIMQLRKLVSHSKWNSDWRFIMQRISFLFSAYLSLTIFHHPFSVVSSNGKGLTRALRANLSITTDINARTSPILSAKGLQFLPKKLGDWENGNETIWKTII